MLCTRVPCVRVPASAFQGKHIASGILDLGVYPCCVSNIESLQLWFGLGVCMFHWVLSTCPCMCYGPLTSLMCSPQPPLPTAILCCVTASRVHVRACVCVCVCSRASVGTYWFWLRFWVVCPCCFNRWMDAAIVDLGVCMSHWVPRACQCV